MKRWLQYFGSFLVGVLIGLGATFSVLIATGYYTHQNAHYATSISVPAPDGIPGNWTNVFDSEFTGNSLPVGWAPYWFKNGATQNNTLMESSNVTVSGGTLNLALTSNSGSIVSTNPAAGGDFQFTYGAMEARIYLPGNGQTVYNWPAFWADGQSWPTDGELDVMEGLHGSTSCHFHDPAGGPSGNCPNVGSGWHTFGAEWSPGVVTYYYDGKAVGSITSGITAQPMYLILENSASGTVTPSTMQVQYVRVWQASSAPPSTTTTVPTPSTSSTSTSTSTIVPPPTTTTTTSSTSTTTTTVPRSCPPVTTTTTTVPHRRKR